MRAGGIGAVQLVTGAAFTEHPLARSRISRSENFLKGGASFFFAARTGFRHVDGIGLGNLLIAMRYCADVIDLFCRPFAQKKHQKWAAQAAIAKGKADVQVHLQSMRDATAIEVERIRAMTKGLVTNEKGLQEQTELQMKQRHAREMSTQHILSGEHAQAMKAAQAQELEAIKVEGEVTRDAISAEIDVEKDAAMRKTPEVKIDVDLPLEK